MPTGGTPDTTSSRHDLVAQVAHPMRQFLATEAGSAGLLLTAVVIALAWANSPLSDSYFSLRTVDIGLNVGDWSLVHSLQRWVDESLMALFFFVIGLEVRRELSMGELTNRRRMVVAAAGSLCGMILPVLIFLAFNRGTPGAHGWGMVINSDTAFLFGALALVGPRVSTQLRVFLLSLAIFDDIVAISIIAIVYSESVNPVAIAVCAACLALIPLLPRLRLTQNTAYLAVGFVLVLVAMESGLHATLPGMLAGLLVAAYRPPAARSRWRPGTRMPSGSPRCRRWLGTRGAACSGRSPRTNASRPCFTRSPAT